MDIEGLKQMFRAWGMFEEQIDAIVAAHRSEKDVSTASYAVCHSIFTTTTQDFLAQPFEKSVSKDSALLSTVGTSMHLFTVASRDMYRFTAENIETAENVESMSMHMPHTVASKLSAENYLPFGLSVTSIASHPHPLSVDDLSIFSITDGKITSIDLSHGNRVSLSFEFACLGDIYTDVKCIDFSFNPRLTLEKICQFLSIHAFKQLKCIRLIGTNHGFKSNEEALDTIRRKEGCSLIEQAIVFDPTLGNKYSTLTFSDLKHTIKECVGQDTEPFVVDTVVFLTTDIQSFELLCLETPPFLANLKNIYMDFPVDYDFDRLFHIKPQIRTINSVPIFNHIVSNATLTSLDSAMRSHIVQLVIDKFYEVCRPIAVDYEGDCYSKSGSYSFIPNKDYFVCSLFPCVLTDPKLNYHTSDEFLNTPLNSSALITLSQTSNIAFTWGRQQPSDEPSRYRVTLLQSNTVDKCDNDLVLALKSGFPLCRTVSSCPSDTLKNSIYTDADSTNWSILPALRVALLSSIIANLSYVPYTFESTCTGIAMCAYWINNMRKHIENSVFVGYIPSINRVIYGVPTILCYLLMRSIKDVILVVLPATYVITDTTTPAGDAVHLYECITEVRIVDEVITGFHTKNLKRRCFQYHSTSVSSSTSISSSSNTNTNTPFNLMTVIERSLELIDLRGFAEKKTTLKVKTYIVPSLDHDGNCNYYSVFSDVL